MQQGDPLGSALFALGNHPCLVEKAQRQPEVLLKGYADNTFFLGPLQAVTKAKPDFQVILQEANLQLKISESNLHVPHWAAQVMSALASGANFPIRLLQQIPFSPGRRGHHYTCT